MKIAEILVELDSTINAAITVPIVKALPSIAHNNSEFRKPEGSLRKGYFLFFAFAFLIFETVVCPCLPLTGIPIFRRVFTFVLP